MPVAFNDVVIQDKAVYRERQAILANIKTEKTLIQLKVEDLAD